MWYLYVIMLFGGFAILSLGGEFLVHGSARLARSLGISGLVVGLTVVAFGTSAPEIAVSVSAGIDNHDDLAIGNVVGSCILNILVVLGIAALVKPLRVSRNILATDLPVMILALAVFVLFAVDGKNIYRWQGLIFVVGLAAYLWLTVRQAKKQPQVVVQEYETGIKTTRSRAFNLLLVVLGLAGLIGGAELIVVGAVELARILNIAEHVIALTVVAIGTSLPEVATCVSAARRGQPDIAVGNVVGSNIFNIMAVIGIASTVAPPLTVKRELILWHAPVMMFVGVLMFPIMRRGRVISRSNAVVLLVAYVIYITYTLLTKSIAAEA